MKKRDSLIADTFKPHVADKAVSSLKYGLIQLYIYHWFVKSEIFLNLLKVKQFECIIRLLNVKYND